MAKTQNQHKNTGQMHKNNNTKGTQNMNIFTHIRCQNSNQVRRDDARERSDTIDDGHQGTSEVGAEVQRVDLHAREEGPHEPHGHGEQGHHGELVVAGVGGQDDADGWSNRSWKIINSK